MNYFRIFSFVAIMQFSFTAKAQDFHFSQFNASPLYLNPALTGSINGKARAIANYRNQWPQALHRDSYMTYAWSYDRRLNLKTGNYLGMGISGSGDVSGGSRFGTIQMNLSLSFAKTIIKKGSTSHSLIGGIQYGIAQRKIDQSTLLWSTAFDDQGRPYHHYHGPLINNPDFVYSDINAGILWLSRYGKRKSFFAGMSIFHINKPNLSFYQNMVQEMSIKTCIHGGAEIPISPRVSLIPSFFYLTHGIHSQFNIGSMLSLGDLSHSFISNVRAGTFYRAGKGLTGRLQSDAIITKLSTQIKGIQFGFSYDITISKLNIHNNLGAIEFSIGYIFNKTKKGANPSEVAPI